MECTPDVVCLTSASKNALHITDYINEKTRVYSDHVIRRVLKLEIGVSKVIWKWLIHRKTRLFCTLLFFPFKFLQQSPVSTGTRSPPHIRFDYFFPLGLRARDRMGHKIERFFIWKKFLLVTILKKKIEPPIADLWKQCTQRNTDSHIKRGNEKHK